jgi:hypothetical protein
MLVDAADVRKVRWIFGEQACRIKSKICRSFIVFVS